MRDNPNLSEEQIDRIRSVAQLRSVQAAEVLYEPSQPDAPLFIVLEGNVSISRTGEDDKILAVREANQFTGEMSVISGKRSLLKARVTGDGSVLELSRDKILSLMAKDTELGEIFMEALVARRLLMIQSGEGNVVLFGAKSSARTLALREFLTRNAHPFTYVDIDSDSFASELMEKLAVRNSEIPVVYCNNRYVLRNPSIAELAQCLDLNINTDKSVRDVVVLSAGPAGLAAAVYAASEGLCDSEEVIAVGGGNSAGQAAVFLAHSSVPVHLFVRSQKLSDSMSQYLIGRIEAHRRIEIHYRTRITGVGGAGHLEHVEWRDDALRETKSGPIRHVFAMAGAAPRTEMARRFPRVGQ